MALDQVALLMIGDKVQGADVLCLGYPDIPGQPDSIWAFKANGAKSIDVVDVIAHKGVERILDLNEPQAWPRRYDLVINPGTLEHCFNLGQAWANAWDAVAVGGHILHVAPATMFNHGFWNFNANAMFDWCGANGGNVVAMRFAENGSGTEVWLSKITSSGSGRGQLPPETVLYALCQKTSDVPLTWPAQGVYRR